MNNTVPNNFNPKNNNILKKIAKQVPGSLPTLSDEWVNAVE